MPAADAASKHGARRRRRGKTRSCTWFPLVPGGRPRACQNDLGEDRPNLVMCVLQECQEGPLQ
eukprot:14952438-Alexandrium_andersonii.AAC.1